MNDQSLWYLENIDVSGIFCPKKVSKGMLEEHTQKDYDKGSYIYLPDEYADKIFFLTDGRVKIGTYSDQGKEVTKAILGPGEVSASCPSSANLPATTLPTLWRIPTSVS